MRRGFGLLLLAFFTSATGLSGQTPEALGPSFQTFLFGDALFTVADADTDDGFKLGQMVAHGNATLSDHVAFFGEVSVRATSSGYVLAMERAIIRYDFGDAVKVSMGRYHTPISYWNTAFHHGLWLQGSVARPEAVRFGSRFVPVHMVGAQVEGRIPNSPVSYTLGIANGRSDNIAGGGDAGDVNGNRALSASFFVTPSDPFGLRVGGAVYIDKVPQPASLDADERIASAHIVWDRGAAEFIAEYIDVSHEAAGANTSNGSSAFYVHAGYRLSGELSAVTPYARFETTDIDEADVVFQTLLTDYQAVVVGVRYDFDDLAALKLEYRSEEIDGGSRLDSYFVQVSWAIPLFGG